MIRVFIVWLINAVAIFLLPHLVAAVQVKDFPAALVVALVIGLLNTFVRPVLFVLTLPINVLTLGLFTFVLNGLMFWLAGRFVGGFSVAGFWWAVLAAIIYSIISWAISSLLMKDRLRGV